MEDLEKAFNWEKRPVVAGRRWPPDIHEIIDFLWELGYYATIIHRHPEFTDPAGVEHYTFVNVDEERQRWQAYADECEGLMLGKTPRFGFHMVHWQKGCPVQDDYAMQKLWFMVVGPRDNG